jgi:hypothetical protein
LNFYQEILDKFKKVKTLAERNKAKNAGFYRAFQLLQLFFEKHRKLGQAVSRIAILISIVM